MSNTKQQNDFLKWTSPVQLRARKGRARRVLQQHYRNLLTGGRLVLLTEAPRQHNGPSMPPPPR